MIVTRQWAAETREKWRLRETEWAEIPVEERCRMIIGHKLREWQSALDLHQQSLEVGSE